MTNIFKIGVLGSLLATSSYADICDYRPSNLIGGAGAGAAATAGTGVATIGLGAKVAGFYTLTHAVTGATMLGSTAVGASAAGTVGIIGGTAGFVGTLGAIIMAPATIIAGVIIGTGTALLEGGCYFVVERVEDPEIILEILRNLADNSDPKYFELYEGKEKSIYVASKIDDKGKVLKRVEYKVKKLYIEEGMLKHKDFGLNTKIGKVGYVENKQDSKNGNK